MWNQVSEEAAFKMAGKQLEALRCWLSAESRAEPLQAPVRTESRFGIRRISRKKVTDRKILILKFGRGCFYF